MAPGSRFRLRSVKGAHGLIDGSKRQQSGPRDQARFPICFYLSPPEVVSAGGDSLLTVKLDDLDQRAVRKALAERKGGLIEIVGDTTKAASSRRAASRELELIASVLSRLTTNRTRPPKAPTHCGKVQQDKERERTAQPSFKPVTPDDGLRLFKAFVRIPDPAIREAVIEWVVRKAENG